MHHLKKQTHKTEHKMHVVCYNLSPWANCKRRKAVQGLGMRLECYTIGQFCQRSIIPSCLMFRSLWNSGVSMIFQSSGSSTICPWMGSLNICVKIANQGSNLCLLVSSHCWNALNYTYTMYLFFFWGHVACLEGVNCNTIIMSIAQITNQNFASGFAFVWWLLYK